MNQALFGLEGLYELPCATSCSTCFRRAAAKQYARVREERVVVADEIPRRVGSAPAAVAHPARQRLVHDVRRRAARVDVDVV